VLKLDCATLGVFDNMLLFKEYVIFFTGEEENIFHYEYFFSRAAEEASSTTDFSSHSGQSKAFTVI
jgi:hypothetical protein